MINWIKDLMGINRYAISYNYPYESTYTGRDGRGMSKFVAQRVAKDMNKIHGPGTHWVVPHNE